MESRSQTRLRQLVSQLSVVPVAKRDVNKKSLVSTKVLSSGVGIIQLTNPPVNSLPPQMIEAIDAASSEMEQNDNVKAVIVTGTKAFFSGGADIKVLQQLSDPKSKEDNSFLIYAHKVLNKLEASKKPYIAAINGFALGGGCELAMACRYRIIDRRAKIGLVETTLGLIPGFGGTQRLPRLVGLELGTYAILNGKSFTADRAFETGLVDEVISNSSQLLTRAEAVALEILDGKRKAEPSLFKTDKIPSTNEAQRLLKRIHRDRVKGFARAPAGAYVINAVRGILAGPKKGLDVELEQFSEIIRSPAARGQIHLFFAQRAAAKLPKQFSTDQKPRQIKKVGILGGGTVGAGVAALLVSRRIPVVMKEISKQKCNDARQRILKNLSRLGDRHEFRDVSASDLLKKYLTVQTNYTGFVKLDLVIECTLEHLALKQSVFRDLYRMCSYNCIFATGTAALDINDIVAKLPHDGKNRVVGLHFFTPAHLMKLVEVIHSPHSEKQRIVDLVSFSKRLGKIPVVVANGPGFLTNRMFFPYRMAADFLIEHGVDVYRIDRALESFGMAVGVSRMTDLAGIDIFNDGQQVYYDLLGSRCYRGRTLKELCDRRRYGQKAGAGFYRYDEDNVPMTDYNGLEDILEVVRAGKPTHLLRDITDEEIVQMVLFPVVNECFRISGEGKVNKVSDLDIASCFGYGFPAKHGGIHYWAANEIGLNEVASKLQRWSLLYGTEDSDGNVQNFFAPSDRLIEVAGFF